MAIEGLSDIVRMPRLGKIRLGELKSREEGKPYPKAVDYFRVEEDGGITSSEAVKAFQSVYGNEPKTLDIMFPTEEVEKFIPQYYTAYTKTRGKMCQGDGVTARRRMETKDSWTIKEISCPGEECDWYAEKKCRRLATLQVILPKVPGLGVWHVSTTSRNSIININSGIELIRKLTGGRVSFIPLKLRLREASVLGPQGHLVSVFVMDLASEDVCFMDIFNAMKTSPIRALLPNPEDDERPIDLYPDAVVGDEKGVNVDKNVDNSVVETKKPVTESAAPKNLAAGRYEGLITVLSLPQAGGRMASLIGEDEKGKLVLLCEQNHERKFEFLSLEPHSSLGVTGKIKTNGQRYVLMDQLVVAPF